MLTPQQLDALPASVVRLWQQVEDDILRDAARRIGQMGTVTATADWQLWRYEQTRLVGTDVVRTLAQYSGRSEDELRRAFADGTAHALAADDRIYRLAGLDPPPIGESAALQNLLNAGFLQTRGEWQNLTRTTADTVARQFENALDRAALQVETGAFDYKTAVKRAVDGLADDMKYITYPGCHTDTLEVAVRRAVLTGVNQNAGSLQLARMDEMGCEFVETTAHGGARPEHAKWQGKVFHRGGAVTVDGVRYEDFVTATGYGTGPGLCGWNCRHQFGPFFPGVTEPIWSDGELERLNAKEIEYQGQMYTRYEISQMQRAAERQVRRCKRRYLAEQSAGADTAQTAVQLRAARQKLEAFIAETGGQTDSSRTGVAGFGRSEAAKATAKAKSVMLTNAEGQVIIRVKKVTLRGTPNSITQVENSKGGIDRNYYGADGWQYKQVSNNGHGHKKEEALGFHGEHAHDYIYDDDKNLRNRPPRDLTEEERKENGDFL